MIEMWVLFSMIGVAIPIIKKVVYHKTITAYEVGAIALVNSLIVGVVLYAGLYSQMADVELLNGQVIEKRIDKVSCSHSYMCNCRTVSCGKGCSTTHCDTCYEHSHDFDHVVESTVGTIVIDREDRQGKTIPARWKAVALNEPVTLAKPFTNYIKAAPDSLFNLTHLHNSEVIVPEYPRVFDYYRVNRVLNSSSEVVNVNEINRLLNLELRQLGPQKEVNVIVVFWDSTNDPSFVDVLRAKWLGGKQNDLIVAVKLTKGEIEAVESFGFSKDSSVYYKVNRLIKDVGTLAGNERAFVDGILESINQSFVRQPMSDFEYLKDNIDPPTWVVVLAAIFSILGTFGASILAHKYDFFGTETSRGMYGNRRR